MATNGQFYWPSAGNSVAAYGQFVMSADIGRVLGATCSASTTRHAPQQNIHETVEDTLRWALLRRQAYALDDDSFFHVTAAAWATRTANIVAGDPFDESRMLRLRTGSSVPDGTYRALMDPEWIGCGPPECARVCGDSAEPCS